MRNRLLALITFFFLLPALAVAQNAPPIADAGPDQSLFVGEPAGMAGTAADADGDAIVGWLWTVESAPAGSNPILTDTFTPDPLFIGDIAGDYVLSLIASDGIDWSVPDTVTITFADILPPVAIADADITAGPAPLTVNFDASQSYDPQGGTLLYGWSFGDSNISSEISPSHEYLFPGTFTVSLTVLDSRGQSDVDTIVIEVGTANTPPVASPTATPESGVAPLLVQFTANASDADGDALTYAWDFGDGTSSTLADPSYTFMNAGLYTVLFSVSDGQDEVASSLMISVDSAGAISVRRLNINYLGRRSTQANIQLKADFAAPDPAPDDIIAVTLDDVTLFAEPFSSFVPIEDDDEDDADDGEVGIYKLKTKGLRVKLDLVNGRINVWNRKINTVGIDTSNGIDVVLDIGTSSALENVLVEEKHGRRFVYHRPAE